jgi:hypothetical protein
MPSLKPGFDPQTKKYLVAKKFLWKGEWFQPNDEFDVEVNGMDHRKTSMMYEQGFLKV